jgi:hypothetical protein
MSSVPYTQGHKSWTDFSTVHDLHGTGDKKSHVLEGDSAKRCLVGSGLIFASVEKDRL